MLIKIRWKCIFNLIFFPPISQPVQAVTLPMYLNKMYHPHNVDIIFFSLQKCLCVCDVRKVYVPINISDFYAFICSNSCAHNIEIPSKSTL